MNVEKISSGQKTASAVISATACDFCGLIMALHGTGAVLDIYDNATAAAGDKLIPTVTIPIPDPDIETEFILDMSDGVRAMNGVYVDVALDGKTTCAYVAYTRNGKAE